MVVKGYGLKSSEVKHIDGDQERPGNELPVVLYQGILPDST